MQLIFSRRRSLGSWLIRIFCWSRWSHVSVQIDAETIIDATFAHGGVRMRTMGELLREASAIETIAVQVADEAAGLAWIAEQLWRPYDWTAIIGFVLRADWAQPSKWFCSELAAGAIHAAGRKLVREDISRVTPGLLWAVAV